MAGRFRVAGYRHPADNPQYVNGILLESEDDENAPGMVVSVSEAMELHAQGKIDTTPDSEKLS